MPNVKHNCTILEATSAKIEVPKIFFAIRKLAWFNKAANFPVIAKAPLELTVQGEYSRRGSRIIIVIR